MSGNDNISWTTRVVSGAISVGLTDYILSFQSLSGASSAALPQADFVPPGREYVIQKDASAQTVTITSPDGVDGGSIVLPAGAVASARVFSDGVTWWSSSKPSSGGGGGSSIQVNPQVITSGNITLPNVGSTWTPVTGLEVSIPASVGDFVELSPSFMWQPTGSKFLELGVIVGSTIVRYSSSSTGTPSIEGDPSLYGGLNTYGKSGTHMGFVVTSGDLDGGNVRFIVAHMGTGATSVIYASTNYPFRWNPKNYGTPA